MKADWEKLEAAFEGDANRLIGDVDCTAEGKPLCTEHGVKGFPTIKHGDVADLQDYKGGRKFADLKKFAEENLGPTCGPANLDLCSSEKKKQIEEFMAMSDADIAAQVKEKNAALEKLESDFKAFVDGLQAQYKEASEKKDKDLEAAKDSGLGLMKSVQAHKQKLAKGEL